MARKEKIHVDQLVEDAWNWWESLYTSTQETIILREYMKEKKIKDEDVDW